MDAQQLVRSVELLSDSELHNETIGWATRALLRVETRSMAREVTEASGADLRMLEDAIYSRYGTGRCSPSSRTPDVRQTPTCCSIITLPLCKTAWHARPHDIAGGMLTDEGFMTTPSEAAVCIRTCTCSQWERVSTTNRGRHRTMGWSEA